MSFWTIRPPAYLSGERPSVLAVDPGKFTGLLHLTGGDDTEGMVGEEEYAPALEWCAALIGTDAVDVVVCETFTITAKTARNTQAPWSLESIGVLRFLCRRAGTPFILQAPALAKRGAVNDRLKHAGWYVPTGGGHSADAARHAYVFYLNQRLLSPPVLNM
jgi:hypothetical protein